MTDDQVLLAERYKLGDRLGRGGMAEVRRGFDLRLQRTVAVKCLKVELAADPTFQERFRREAHAAASLNHPGIAAVYDTGEQTDPTTAVPVPFLVMELVDGPTLRDVLRDEGALPVGRALELTRVVLGALAHSHAAGIVHRDIKPSNIMLTPSGDAKVMDFGIARAAETTSDLTGTAAVIGTAHYLSPEQARGERVDQRSDLYSTGCLLYELLLGRPPFLGDSSVSVAYQHVREMPVPPSEIDPALGPDVDALIDKALAKDPADRYQSADEMADDVSRVLAGQPAHAAGPSEQSENTHVVPAVPAPVTVTAAEVREEATSTLPGPVVTVAGAAEADGGAGLAAGGTAVADAVVDARAAHTLPTASTGVATPDELTESSRSNTGRSLLLALMTLLVLAGLAFAAYQLLGPGESDRVSVPSVLGATRAAAEQELRDAGLQPAFRHVDGPDDDTIGTVIRQTPEQGADVPPRSTVTAEINVGPATARIPEDLVGRDVDEVLDELSEAGFTNVTARPVANPPEGADPDEVVGVDPAEGEKAAPEEDITVSYVGRSGKAAPTSRPRTEPTGRTTGPTATEEPTQEEQTESSAPSEDPTVGPSTAPPESSEPEPSETQPTGSVPSGGAPSAEAPTELPSGEAIVDPPVSVDPAQASQAPVA